MEAPSEGCRAFSASEGERGSASDSTDRAYGVGVTPVAPPTVGVRPAEVVGVASAPVVAVAMAVGVIAALVVGVPAAIGVAVIAADGVVVIAALGVIVPAAAAVADATGVIAADGVIVIAALGVVAAPGVVAALGVATALTVIVADLAKLSATGAPPTLRVSETVRPPVLITETVPLPLLATYADAPVSLNTTSRGSVPTVILPSELAVVGSTTWTLLAGAISVA